MRTWAWPLLAVFLLNLNAWAYDPEKVEVTGHELPKALENVGVDERLGASIDLGLAFTDDKGVTAPIGRYFRGEKPVLMAIVYYSCPSLCNYHLNGLTETFKQLKWTAGKDFDVVAVSMLSTETPELAAAKKASYIKAYGHPEAADGWHFLTGSKENIQRLADQVGFKFKWIPESQQFSHASVAYVITPAGTISRYLHGIQPDAQTLRLSLLEAGQGKIGNVIEKVMLFCFEFNPKKGKFTLYAWNIMRIGAIVMVLLLAVILLPLWRREQQHHRTRT